MLNSLLSIPNSWLSGGIRIQTEAQNALATLSYLPHGHHPA